VTAEDARSISYKALISKYLSGESKEPVTLKTIDEEVEQMLQHVAKEATKGYTAIYWSFGPYEGENEIPHPSQAAIEKLRKLGFGYKYKHIPARGDYDYGSSSAYLSW
jgi:hypothetical protein